MSDVLISTPCKCYAIVVSDKLGKNDPPACISTDSVEELFKLLPPALIKAGEGWVYVFLNGVLQENFVPAVRFQIFGGSIRLLPFDSSCIEKQQTDRLDDSCNAAAFRFNLSALAAHIGSFS